MYSKDRCSNISLPKNYRIRQLILIISDILLVMLSFFLSLGSIDLLKETGINLICYVLMYSIVNTISFTIFKCYSSLWRYAGEEEAMSVFIASCVYIIPMFIVMKFMNLDLPILFFVINTITIIALTGGIRLIYRVARRFLIRLNINKNATRVLIIGAGSAGVIIIDELFNNPSLEKKPVAIVDDDVNKIGRRIRGVLVLGNTDDISNIVKKENIDEIIFCIASISRERKNEIIDICKETNCKLKTIPGIYEIIDDKVDIKEIRDVDIEDLLGREQVDINLEEISGYLNNKTILVTGGGGSIGSELCRQIALFSPKILIILDIYENNAYDIQQEISRKYKEEINVKIIIASIRDEKRMDKIFDKYRPNIVFHAAAHKHVPLMEENPSEAIKNNIFGTVNITKMADKYKIEKFVLISSDKAVNPTNIMGATKRASEIYIQIINEESKTEFVAVRFGNVLGSNGSVIPLFKKQIKEGGPVTITHPDIMRYFMTISEAVQLVMQAGAMAKGGEIFILDMKEPIKIMDLANNLIRLSGLKVGEDINIEFSGLRPGEKLYEELYMKDEEICITPNKSIFISKPVNINKENFKLSLELLKSVTDNEDIESIEYIIKSIVPTYRKIKY